MIGILGCKKSLMISSAMWIQYINVTDGHQMTEKTALSLRIVSRGKNDASVLY